MQLLHKREEGNTLHDACASRRVEMLNMLERQNSRFGWNIDIVAIAFEHFANEAHHVIVLTAILLIIHKEHCELFTLFGR